MGHPQRISSTFLSLYGRVGVEAAACIGKRRREIRGSKSEEGKWSVQVSSSDNERTVCLSRSNPNVLRIKSTKQNIVGIYLYTVFVRVVFLCTGDCSVCGCDCSYNNLGWWRVVGLIITSTSRVKRHPHAVRSRSSLLG